MTANPQFDPRLDLKLERVVEVPPELVWAAWTVPEHVKKWFTPAPWQTVDCEIDLRPGGIFRTVMRSPAGQEITISAVFSKSFRTEGWYGRSRFGPASGLQALVSIFRPLLRSLPWSRMARERSTPLSPCIRTRRAVTPTTAWGSATGGARRSISSSSTRRRCRQVREPISQPIEARQATLRDLARTA